jgi:hypothetical protein
MSGDALIKIDKWYFRFSKVDGKMSFEKHL